MRTLTKYGTYGFLCALISIQTASATSDRNDRTLLNTKKSARAMKYDAKKTGRKITGNDNAWDNTKDSVSETTETLKEDAHHAKKKLERNAE